MPFLHRCLERLGEVVPVRPQNTCGPRSSDSTSPGRRASVMIIRWPGTCPCPRRSVLGVGRKKRNRALGPNHLSPVGLSVPTPATGRRRALRIGTGKSLFNHHPSEVAAILQSPRDAKKTPGQKGRLFTQAGLPATIKGATGIEIAISGQPRPHQSSDC